jgi:oligosaccharyltransferase complex subunit epsilon
MAGPKSPKHAPASKPKPTTTPTTTTTTAPSSSASASAPASALSFASTAALRTLWMAYVDATPARLKLVDAFLVFLFLSGAVQFAYCVLVTNFPYNAFLAG